MLWTEINFFGSVQKLLLKTRKNWTEIRIKTKIFRAKVRQVVISLLEF